MERLPVRIRGGRCASPSLDRLQFDILSAAFSLMCGLCRQLGRLEALQLADAVPFDLADRLVLPVA